MTPDDLVGQARRLLRASPTRPRDVDLRRAVSAGYYALFHVIAGEAANLLVGTSGTNRSEKAWRQVYRALHHGDAKTRCENLPPGFDRAFRNIASEFVELQKQRHDADYDPTARFSRRSAQNVVQRAEAAIATFRGAPVKDRRAFVVWLLFPNRR